MEHFRLLAAMASVPPPVHVTVIRDCHERGVVAQTVHKPSEAPVHGGGHVAVAVRFASVLVARVVAGQQAHDPQPGRGSTEALQRLVAGLGLPRDQVSRFH